MGTLLKYGRFQSAWTGVGKAEWEVCSLFLPTVDWYQGLFPAFAYFQWCVKDCCTNFQIRLSWSLEFLRYLANLSSTSYLAKTKIRGSTLSYLAFSSTVTDSLPTYMLCSVVFFKPLVCTHVFKGGISDSQIHHGSHLPCLQRSLAQRAYIGSIAEFGSYHNR